MSYTRSSGILLHPTSLPGPYGIGDIGPEAYRWIDFLADTGCSLWQVLPLGPTGYGDSPYQCFSAFAGNPYLISPDALLAEDLLHPDDLIEGNDLPQDRVDFGSLIPYKLGILDRAYIRFQQSGSPGVHAEFRNFEDRENHWLGDFALFMAIKEAYGGGSWVKWPASLRSRDPQALGEFKEQNAVNVERHAFRQFLFHRQWDELHSYASDHGIRIIGDIPIFVAHDSADVWANPELFFLDKEGSPTVVAGVPPDYFSPTGQLWGNPLYRWNVHAATDYEWWIARFRAVLSHVDIVRLDHFRGFAAYWEIPGDEVTAINGKWIPGPGADFLKVLKGALGELPIIAEDLGVITPDVVKLRDQFNLPGMKILVFAFDGKTNNPFLPHNYSNHCVVYTGTHDNDTTLGWYQRVDENERDLARRYLQSDGEDISWDLIHAAWSSVGVFALAPLQDFLGLDNRARMNYPSRLGGNWAWRMPSDALSEPLCARLHEYNFLYGRLPSDRSGSTSDSAN
jgi:4-alpha-glucanotransferase